MNARLILLGFAMLVAMPVHATVNEFYTILFSHGRIEKDASANRVTYIFTGPSLSDEEISSQEEQLAQGEMRIACSPSKSVISVTKNNAWANADFKNEEACRSTIKKIMDRKSFNASDSQFSLWRLEVRFNPATNDISFEY